MKYKDIVSHMLSASRAQMTSTEIAFLENTLIELNSRHFVSLGWRTESTLLVIMQAHYFMPSKNPTTTAGYVPLSSQ